MTHRPKLGQHFLASAQYRKRIADTLRLRSNDLVIEIGPGRGAMTERLAERAGRVIAVELDAALAARLKEEFAASPNVRITDGDILTVEISKICASESVDACYVFGNLPYYITSPILHRLFEFRANIHGMALLMQREVAERIVAAPGSRDYGYLSVMVHLFSQPQILFSIPPGAFSPPPNVQSALVEFRMTAKFPAWDDKTTGNFLEFIKACFAQKRKNLLNNLSALAPRRRIEDTLSKLGLAATSRAEQLTLENFAALFEALAANT